MLHYFVLFSLISLTPALGAACASCGCSLSSDWQDPSQNGFKFDLRYDYLNQNQLRSGTSTISGAAASQRTNNGDPQEVEQNTANNYVTASLDYSIDSSWKLSLLAPYVIRGHQTLGTASDGSTAGPDGGEYSSHTENLGDLKLMARYQGFSPEHSWGVLFGLKLPTGRHDLTGDSTDPTAPGPVPIDRGLQPGSGTTDLLLGLYTTKALNKNWDYFGEALYQAALNFSDQYRPGDGFNLNLGFRYVGFDSFSPQIQLNSRFVEHDFGDQADTTSTGGILVYLSPGVVVPVIQQLEVYAFMQVPVYQYLRGVQLAPTSTESLGVRYYF